MGVNTVDVRNTGVANTSRLPSPDIWADCPFHDLRELTQVGPGVGPGGIHFFDDFDDVPLAGTQTTQIAMGKWKTFNTGAGTNRGISTINSVEMPGGWLAMNLDTDNDSFSHAQAYPSFLLSGLNTNSGKLWFEARCAFTPVTTNGLGWFVGLAEVEQWTLATAVPFNAGDAITNAASAVGFRKPEDNTTTADTVTSDRATSFTAVGTAELTGLAAYTPFKIGLVYDPDRSTDCIRFYFNNVQLATVIARSTVTGYTNFDANAMGLIIAGIADSAGTSAEFYCDWIRCAQLLPTI